MFTPDPKAHWKSAKSGVTYPLGWDVTFPDRGLSLHLTASVQDQEMPILGPGAGIWEGMCQVDAYQGPVLAPGQVFDGPVTHIPGVAYMELVGYSSPAVKNQMAKAGLARKK